MDNNWIIKEYEEEIFDLRDQVNAAMDTIHHLAGNGQQFEWAMDYYQDRVKKQKETRTPNIKYLGNKIAKDRRKALEQLVEMSEELPGGYLGDTE